MLRLHTYFRSSAAYRVRIALALKGLDYESLPLHLLREGGEQHGSAYRALNPAGLVPLLQDGGLSLDQSLAIIEYLEELHPAPALLPADAAGRARVRALALAVACDIHPLNNLRVLQYLDRRLQVAEPARNAWVQHWIGLGFDALEQSLARSPATGRCCHGDHPSLADCCLVPQAFNARRFGLELDRWPTLARIVGHCETLDAFAAAHPARQPDAT